MPATQPPSSASSRRRATFQSTLWSQVRQAGSDVAPSSEALETLCRVYWPPIYAFLRQTGHERQTARDLTQAFFAYVLEEGLLRKADPARGRFRSFLIGSLKYFLSNLQARERAQKRGGGVDFVSIDEEMEDGRMLYEPVTPLTPEHAFDRKWAVSVLAEAMSRLAAEYRRGGLAAQFDLLQPHLTGDATGHLPALAAQLGKSDGAVRVLVCRLRNRFRRLVREVIADTVGSPEQVELELQHLGAALRDEGSV